jgi:protein-S-isoprenylcysteine O-methyltransferase Ste14
MCSQDIHHTLHSGLHSLVGLPKTGYYAFMFLSLDNFVQFAGLSVYFEQIWWAVLAIYVVGMASIVGAFVIRIAKEEAMLKKEFGKEWTAYAQKTARLLPYIY